MKRRTFLATGAVSAAGLAAPAIGRAAATRVLKFVPQSDVTILDPIWTTAYVTRNHGFMIFDTLYGIDNSYAAKPQMVAGHTVDADGKQWTLTLRDGLRWHDGEKVLARDCVASIKRWGARDPFGLTLMAYTDELSAPDDKTIRFRLKRPFPLLPDALGKPGSNFCAMMPERLAKTSAFTAITEMVGSGPFMWNAKERVVGSRAVYERNPHYVPRSGGTPEWTSGPKVAYFDRVEWHVIPDESTKANALTTGEIDWWENPTSDMLPLLRLSKNVAVRVTDPTGLMACMRLNQLWPPFDNPAIRRALLKAVNQTEYMVAVAGTDPKMWHVPAGIFAPDTPMASTAGLSVFEGKRDYAAVAKEIKAAGYKGEKVVLLAPTDFPILKAEADVCNDMMKRIGLNVDYQAMDWGTVVQRRAQERSPEKGGWSVFNTFWSGLDQFNPVGHVFLRGNGKKGMMGWPSAPKIEALRQQWIEAPTLAAQKKLAVELQLQALHDVPYIPLGQSFAATAYRKSIQGILNGFVIFWNVRRA
ncbi:MAG: ABC transporter substrate-binding protein [Rhodospirillales bacterium]|jgi:peptide/nickel transport system substrate-binding protein|nr:ABC transporter substrate-binding protein [Rhodospirillales bacterium]